MFSSMLLTHAQDASSNTTAPSWAPSSNSTNGTNTTTAAPAQQHEAASAIWLLGVFLEVLATFVGTVGKQMVRYSTILIDRKVAADAAAVVLIDPDVSSLPPAVKAVTTIDVGTQTAAPKTCGSWITPTIAIRIGLFSNTACGPLLEMAAYTFAPQSTLAPFGGLDTVWNALLAPFTLGEKFTRQ